MHGWMPHPSGLEGNSAVALISREGQDNDEFGGFMKPTAHLDKCEYHKQVMASFEEVLARSRLMKLEAGSKVSMPTNTCAVNVSGRPKRSVTQSPISTAIHVAAT